MNKVRFSLNVLAAAIFLLAVNSLAQAQATRTWVSGVGDDANPCSRTAPCKTFAGAISKTAAGGEIDALDPAGFGAITVTKAITIDGGGTGSGFGGILNAGSNGVTVNAGINDVINLRNLVINGAGTGTKGVNILAGKAVFIENCRIFNQAGNGIFDGRNLVGAKLFISDTTVSNNAATGINLAPIGGTLDVTVDRVRVENNVNIGFASSGSFCKVTITESVFSGQTGSGVFAAGGTQINLTRCTTSHNQHGIHSEGGSTVAITDVTITNNTNNSLDISGGSVLSYGNNYIRGNGTDVLPNGSVSQH